jgi:hypothetical protein
MSLENVFVEALEDANGRLRSENIELKTALRRAMEYARHRSDCDYNQTSVWSCTCGLSDLKAKYPAPAEGDRP